MIDLQPGDKIFLKIDSLDYYNGFTISGNNQNDLMFMKTLFADSKFRSEFGDSYSNLVNREKDIATNLILRNQRAQYQLSFLDKYNEQHPLNRHFYNWVKSQFVYEPYCRISLSNLRGSSPEETRKFLLIINNLNINNNTAALISNNYNDFIQYYSILRTSGNLMKYRPSELFSFGITNLKESTADVLMTKQIIEIMPIDSIFNRLYPQYISRVKNKKLLDLVSYYKEKYMLAKAQDEVKNPSVGMSTELSQIFQKYNGKVIYIDFWASWCGPCRAEIPNSIRLANKYEGKNVVFLYLGYNDIKLNWLIARKDLKLIGENILLTDNLINEATTKFKITGIPHYALITKDGKIYASNAPRPSDEEIESIINSLISR